MPRLAEVERGQWVAAAALFAAGALLLFLANEGAGSVVGGLATLAVIASGFCLQTSP
jgi:hypothetical protein